MAYLKLLLAYILYVFVYMPLFLGSQYSIMNSDLCKEENLNFLLDLLINDYLQQASFDDFIREAKTRYINCILKDANKVSDAIDKAIEFNMEEHYEAYLKRIYIKNMDKELQALFKTYENYKEFNIWCVKECDNLYDEKKCFNIKECYNYYLKEEYEKNMDPNIKLIFETYEEYKSFIDSFDEFKDMYGEKCWDVLINKR